MKNHLDLFSGIGGFALAAEIVWGKNINHTFVEYDPYCQEILKKHWPKAELHGDIRRFIADTKYRIEHPQEALRTGRASALDSYILTGGFPCQPFSQAGRRKGTDDDRYLWPQMFDCIQLFKPEWVVAENVAGLATWNDGLVLETVCADMESEGYEVQPFIIPAAAVEAPHRRDRVWIIAHAPHAESSGRDEAPQGQQHGGRRSSRRISSSQNRNVRTDAHGEGYARDGESRTQIVGRGGLSNREGDAQRGHGWGSDWVEVAAALCRMDDGVSRRLDRTPRLKALGNAIVPQVAAEIFRSIASS